jgi:hypothetical protein
MKNIHLIPTDKPSRLHLGKSGLVLCDLVFNPTTINSQNIYITSDEEIKVGDYIIELDGNEVFRSKGVMGKNDWCKKIILTTDQDLIKDGVQSIDDTFLEWFVKNPSCESVEVSYEVLKPFQSIDKGYILRLPDTDVLEKPKQETLKEFAEEYYIDNIFCDGITEFEHDIAIRCYIAGAKHTAERMYSEKEVENIITKLMHEVHTGDICYSNNVIDFKISPRKWFEQFKKK